ncbi:MAG: HlyC/CorC family transporter [Acidobacteria bacterium]|nr:HlyC/CorC family transporter [Acidobacteriota bacterium]
MTVETVELAAILVCLVFLFGLSLVEAAFTQSSPFTLKMMLERDEKISSSLLQAYLENPVHLLTTIHFGTQLATITIAILATHVSLIRWGKWGLFVSFTVILLISLVFRQLVPRLLTQSAPEEKTLHLARAFGSVYSVLSFVASPLSGVLGLFRKLQEETAPASQPPGEERAEEEIQAYLEIGEDEGIIAKEDSKLIQSVVEFGDTLVREVMTPRMDIVACDERTTVGELRDIMVRHRHSRIPIYRGDVDHIVGIVHIRQLLARVGTGVESEPISGLIHPVLFVPETKPVSSLLKEMQQRGDQAAIVIDEFGGVSGMVTMEDLLEEIVGDIRDEDQAAVSEITKEGPRSYVVRGNSEMDLLRDVTGRRFDGYDCSTVAGLVIAFLGRVPAPGEEFDIEGVRFRIADADRRRVRRVRIELPPADTEGGTATS